MASVWLLPAFTTIVGLIVSVVTVIVIIKINKATAKIDVMPNSPKIDVKTRREFTDGYVSGIVKCAIPRKNKTVYFEFYPDDIEQGENVKKPEIQRLVVGRQFLKFYAKGELSSRRDLIQVLSRNPTDLPEKMRETDEGKYLTKEAQLSYLERTFGKAIQAGDEAITEIMSDFARGQMTRSALAQLKEENAQIRNIFQNNEETKK